MNAPLPTTETTVRGKRILLVAATGLGKTTVLAGITRHWPRGRIMLLSHRFELNQQAISEFERINGEPVDLEQAEYHADRNRKHRVVVASIQTLNSTRKGRLRMEKFNPAEFGLILIDEAHHAAAAGYRRILDYFQNANPSIGVVGVTATPDRLDGVGMGQVFDAVGADYNLLWAIDNGWLVEPIQKFCHIEGLDLRQVHTRGGDLQADELNRILEMEKNLHEMAEPIVDALGTDRHGLVFTSSVAQAHRLCEIMRDYATRKGFPGVFESFDGSWQPSDPRRKDMIAKFKRREIQCLINCMVLTEGFDCPTVDVVAIGRPTKSRALYQQMLGRGTRALPGVVDGPATAEERKAAIAASAKPNCLVIDFVGQCGKHALVCTTDILAGDAEAEVVEAAKALQREPNGFKKSTLEVIREADAAIKLKREAQRAKITAKVDYELRDVTTLYDLAQIPKVPVPGWAWKKPPSDRQRGLLLKLGYTEVQIQKLNCKTCSAAIDYAIENPRNKFGKWLRHMQIKEGLRNEDGSKKE